MPVRKKPVLVKGPEFAAIRAFRTENRDEQLKRELAFLGAGHRPIAQLAGALRAARRGVSSGKGYDLARHYALVRLLRRPYPEIPGPA